MNDMNGRLDGLRKEQRKEGMEIEEKEEEIIKDAEKQKL